MARKIQIFDELMKGFREGIARKKGCHVALRVTEIRRVKPTRPIKQRQNGRHDKVTPNLED